MHSDYESYKSEVQEKWGKTEAYRQHAEKTKNYSKQKWDDLSRGMDDILSEFALCMKNNNTPASQETQHLVQQLQNHITDNFYTCTTPVLAGLGQMYVADGRFKQNIDKHGDGTAEFIREAIEIYCAK